MPRPICPGSGLPPKGNVTGITGRCAICAREFLLTKQGNLKTHKQPK